MPKSHLSRRKKSVKHRVQHRPNKNRLRAMLRRSCNERTSSTEPVPSPHTNCNSNCSCLLSNDMFMPPGILSNTPSIPSLNAARSTASTIATTNDEQSQFNMPFCQNCLRMQIPGIDLTSPYYLTFVSVPGNNVRKCRSALRTIGQKESRMRRRNVYNLCLQCSHYLDKSNISQNKTYKEWKNTYPAFLWNMLSGKDVVTNLYHHQVYSGSELWQMIPKTFRRYWLHVLNGEGTSKAYLEGLRRLELNWMDPQSYEGCNLGCPVPHFVDRTNEINSFESDVKSYELSRLLRAMNWSADCNASITDSMILPSVACPWGCSEFPWRTTQSNYALLMQKYLRKIHLTMPSNDYYQRMYAVETSRDDYLRIPSSDYDCVLMNDNWPVRPHFALTEDGVFALCCRNHGNVRNCKRLYPHPPRKPHHNLSSVYSDELCSASIKPRIFKSMKANSFSSSFAMFVQQASFSGIDSFNVTLDPRFTRHSHLMTQHEILSLSNRPDLNSLLSTKVRENIVPQGYADFLRKESECYIDNSSLQELKDASTYIESEDAIVLQTNPPNATIRCVIRKGEIGNVTIEVCRSWLPTINFHQTEDSSGYGTPFRSISNYISRKGKPTMMLYCLAAVISGCKQLHCMIDRKSLPFHYDEWEGHMLAHLHGECMTFADPMKAGDSPFSCNIKEDRLMKFIEKRMPDEVSNYPADSYENPELFYRFNFNYWQSLFPRDLYPNLALLSCFDEACNIDTTSKTVIVVVDKERPFDRSGNPVNGLSVGSSFYESRVIVSIGFDEPNNSCTTPTKFEAQTLVRHGGVHRNWFTQKRGYGAPQIMTKYSSEDSSLLRKSQVPLASSRYVSVYVKKYRTGTSQTISDEIKLTLHKSLGGQTHVYCACERGNKFPMIVTGTHSKMKRECLVVGCKGKEYYVCPSLECPNRICRACFEKHPQDRSSTVPVAVVKNFESSLRERISSARKKNVCREQRGQSLAQQAPLVTQPSDSDSDDDHSTSHRCLDTDVLDDDVMLDDFLTQPDFNPVDTQVPDDELVDPLDQIMTSAGEPFVQQLPRGTFIANSVPCHVLFNQAAALCTRWNKRIKGGTPQQNFAQRLVSTVTGYSVPLLYMMGCCFPKHYWSASSGDPTSILGCAPISCYSNSTNPHGYASTLHVSRNLLTHSSSSTSTCHNFTAFCYDIQANKASSGIDSRIIARNGFEVDVKSNNGLAARGKDESTLKESVDSHQLALDLAGTQPFIGWDLFLTFTCNQSQHPGIWHLHQWKESGAWKAKFPNHDRLADYDQDDVKRSFEMAYGTIVTRCWFEVRKLWLEYLMFSTTSILAKYSKVSHAFFRDEYQEERSGNLPHIHGLFALQKDDYAIQEVKEHIDSLQACGVCDLFPRSKLDSYIEQGLFVNEDDWQTHVPQLQELGAKILSHRCNQGCLRRVDNGNGPPIYICRKVHPVKGRKDPTVSEMVPLPFKYSEPCLEILKDLGYWKDGDGDAPMGYFSLDILQPKRHMGAVHPGCEENMSPVIDHFFATTKSMQNAQILTGECGAVSRYVAKYIVKLDEGNRIIVWADQHTGAVLRAEKNFLHNTKITSSRIAENKAHEKSRKAKHPTGRAIAVTEMIQHLLGEPEVMTTIEFERISTKKFELRPTTKIRLNSDGRIDESVLQDAHTTMSPCHQPRIHKVPDRPLTDSQNLLFRGNSSYDKVTRFGLRPVELLDIVRNLGLYYRLFSIDNTPTGSNEIQSLLDENIKSCPWFDATGCRVRLRRKAAKEFRSHLELVSLTDVERFKHIESRILMKHFLDKLEDLNEIIYDETFWEHASSVKYDLPIPVYSSITPNNPSDFLLHIMLVLGQFETELDLRLQPTIREGLIASNLIGTETDCDSLRDYSRQLLKRVINEVLPIQPLKMGRFGDCIVKAKHVLDSVILNDDIPITEIPPCILSELLDGKDKELSLFWSQKMSDQLDAIYQSPLASMEHIPQIDDVKLACSQRYALDWNQLASFSRGEGQCEQSFNEQRNIIKIALSSLKDYQIQFGPRALKFTRGLIIHGAPGCGKTHVVMYISLMAMSFGLKVMTTALMGVRANALGGIHVHCLFCLMAKDSSNPYRAAELALDKLHRKSMLKHLHVVLTMDVLIIDECGQLSAVQLSILDIVIRKARNTDIPFGGVLIFGSMDHAQLGAIKAWPFLLSSHILTDFNLVALTKSVRASNDLNYQRIMEITRMSPNYLKGNMAIEHEFKRLVGTYFNFVDSWDKVPPGVTRMYPKRIPAAQAANQYVTDIQKMFDETGTDYSISHARDLERVVGSRGEYTLSRSDHVTSCLDHAMKEPRRLLFWRGATYHATVNGNGYNQSQILMLLHVPSQSDIDHKRDIKMYASPGGATTCLRDNDDVPTEEELIAKGWTAVQIKHIEPRPVTHKGIVACREQYTLCHVGASTINKVRTQTHA